MALSGKNKIPTRLLINFNVFLSSKCLIPYGDDNFENFVDNNERM